MRPIYCASVTLVTLLLPGCGAGDGDGEGSAIQAAAAAALGQEDAVATSGSVLPQQAAAQQGTAKLIAPTYPGAISVPHENEEGYLSEWRVIYSYSRDVFTDKTRSFFSKDPIETVRAYYDREIGEMQNRPLGAFSESMKPGPYIFARLMGRYEGGPGELTQFFGIELRALEPREVDTPTNYPAVGPIFQKLTVGQISGQATQGQFDALVEEYKHLAWMFYPLTDERNERGRRLVMDKVVFNQCVKQAAGGMSREEVMAKMAELTQQGRTQELQKLMEKVMGAGGSSSWDTWVDCLKKLEDEGYRTLITIHLQP